MSTPNISFWEDALINRKYDLIVVGAGLTGQSIAHFYKKEHPAARVLLLDRGFYPLGASTRNAGFACFGSVTEHMADLKIEDEAKIIDRIRRRIEGLNLLRSTLGDEAIGFETTGGCELFTDREIFEQARDFIPECNRWLKRVSGVDEVYEPSDINGYPGINIKLEGALHPGKMMQRLQDLNTGMGIEYRWQTTVQDIDGDKGVVLLESGHSLKAEKIAVAVNSFTSSLMPAKNVEPGRGYVFVTKPLKKLNWKGVFHYDGGYVYFRNVGENRLLLGGARNTDRSTEQTTEFGTNRSIKAHLSDFASGVLKLEDDWDIEREWSGIMGFTQTKSPILEMQSDRVLLAAGLSGMGVALGMQLGREGASVLTG